MCGSADFEHADFDPITLSDADGNDHEFHFLLRHYGNGLSLKAFELQDGVPGGYVHEVAGEPDSAPMGLFQRLFAKMRLGLSRKHLEPGEFSSSLGPDDIVRGRIEWDPQSDGDTPALSIDGRTISWSDFGRILMAYEGFQFKLEIRDLTEDL